MFLTIHKITKQKQKVLNKFNNLIFLNSLKKTISGNNNISIKNCLIKKVFKEKTNILLKIIFF